MPYERSFETRLWNSRLIVPVAVVASLAVALVLSHRTGGHQGTKGGHG